MNVAQLHLILTHVPLVGFIASVVLLFYALWRRSDEVRTIALIGIALSGLIILPVLATGNASEDVVEHLAGVTESLISRHEHAADTAGALAVAAAVAALLSLFAQRWVPRLARLSSVAVVALVLAASASIGWTSHLGGMIRHPEIALAWNATGGGENDGGERDKARKGDRAGAEHGKGDGGKDHDDD